MCLVDPRESYKNSSPQSLNALLKQLSQLGASPVLLQACILLLAFVLLAAAARWRYARRAELPPGPFCWPIVGCLFSMKFPLRIGTVSYVVVSDRESAMEVLQTRDHEFFYRPPASYFKRFTFDYNDMFFNPCCGDTWKKRQEEMAAAVGKIRKLCRGEHQEAVSLEQIVREYLTNITSLNIFGEKLENVMRVIRKGSEIITASASINISELLPALAWLDLNGVDAKLRDEIMPELDFLLTQQIRERRSSENNSSSFVDTLTSLNGEDAISDALQGVITFALAELINHRSIRLKVQEELDRVVGTQRLVEESDIPSLPYMQAVLKESLRLHPGAPIGGSHFSIQESRIGKHRVPEKFKPERFLEAKVTHNGRHFEYIPFGAGRRFCVGAPLVVRVIPLVVATLMQVYDWNPLPGLERVDLSEGEGWSLRLAKELVAVATPRLSKTNAKPEVMVASCSELRPASE